MSATSTLNDTQPSEIVGGVIRISLYWVATGLAVFTLRTTPVAWSAARLAGLSIISSIAITTLAYASMATHAKFNSLVGAQAAWSRAGFSLLTSLLEVACVLYLVSAINQLLF